MKSKILISICIIASILIFSSCNSTKSENLTTNNDLQNDFDKNNKLNDLQNDLDKNNNLDDLAENDKQDNLNVNSAFYYPLIPLSEIDEEKVNNAKIYFRLGKRIYLDTTMYFFERNGNTLTTNEQEFIVVRNSSRALFCEGYDEGYSSNSFVDKINSEEFKRIYDFSSNYDIKHQSSVLKINGFSEDSNKMKVESYNLGYNVSNITINAFIKRNDDGKTFDVIIDPAFMYGLPVYHESEKECKFNINGLNIKADTLQFTASSTEKIDSLNSIDDKYQYVKLNINNLAIRYEVYSGYSSSAYLTSCTPISTDTTTILTDYVDNNFSNKDPNMELVYNTLISNMDMINTENTLGIILLDLDFDEFPELLVSKKTTYESLEEGTLDAADVDIYRIKDNTLVYVDTLYNYHRVVYELGNVIGIKTLEDGTKAWFNMSYNDRNTLEVCDTDYLFTLNGDKLNFTEVFRKDKDGNYYHFGEKMIFETKEEYYPERDETVTITSWNDFVSPYGTWALIGRIKEAYCEDMKENTYTLYSDWLADLDPYEPSVKKDYSERSIKYDIANLVDAYFLGEYNPSKKIYEYRFLGDFAKPVIYLYPENKMDVSVEIDLNGELSCTYPDYQNGWDVTAYPDGKIINKNDNREYSYLYWEGKGNVAWDLSKGFVVKGSDTIKFLQEKLEYMGLEPKELNEFIVYWLPYMQGNKYNLITFQTDVYEDNAKLNISPKPDSILRIFMVFKPLDEYKDIEEQQLKSFERNGFTVIEWGGTEIE